MDCVTTPVQTVFSTPVVVGTITRTVTTLVVVTVTENRYSIVRPRGQGSGGPGDTSNAKDRPRPSWSTSFITELTTTVGDPIPIETQYGTSCRDLSPSSAPTPTPTPDFTSEVGVTTQSTSSSSPAPSATQDSTASTRRFTNVGTVIGEAIAGVVALLVIIFLIFKCCRRNRGGREASGGLQGDYGGEKADLHLEPESGGGAGGPGVASTQGHANGVFLNPSDQPSNAGNPFATPTDQQNRPNAKTGASKASYFGTQEAAANQVPPNVMATALSAAIPASESKAKLIAGGKIPASSTSSTMTNPTSSTPGAGGADQPVANAMASALSAVGVTSEQKAGLIAKDKIRTNSGSPAMTRPLLSVAGHATSSFLPQTRAESSSSTPQPADPPVSPAD
ncbi:hypothetical protein FRC00_001976 [Tulasnella sp. 408]|nr:hypothetical protein FRC00_001976 [Tulasnella sp. 408]